MSIVLAGPFQCPRLSTAGIIIEAARRKYGAYDLEIIGLDPENIALIARHDGRDLTGVLHLGEALLSQNAELIFTMDDEGLGRFLGYFPTIGLGRICNLDLDRIRDYRGDTNDPEYFIDIFDALAPALIRYLNPAAESEEQTRREADDLWYYIFSTVFD
jgi:hypothetical protein